MNKNLPEICSQGSGNAKFEWRLNVDFAFQGISLQFYHNNRIETKLC